MTTRKIAIHNVETGEIEIRDFTTEELAEVEAQKAAHNETQATATAARQAILDRLGLTAEEAALLLGAN